MSFIAWLNLIMGSIMILHLLIPISFGLLCLLSLSISKRIKSEAVRQRFEDLAGKFRNIVKIYDNKVGYKVVRLYLTLFTIYYAINPIFLTVTTKQEMISKYLSFVVSVLIILLSEFWFLFKKGTRNALEFISKLASPLVFGLYLLFLIICYIPELKNVDFLKPYLTDENRNILAGGFVIFIALRRLIDDIKKKYKLDENYVSKKKRQKPKENDVSTQVVSASEN